MLWVSVNTFSGPQCELVFCKLIVLSCINKGHYYYYDNVFVSSSSINFQSKLLSWYACFFVYNKGLICIYMYNPDKSRDETLPSSSYHWLFIKQEEIKLREKWGH